MENERYVTASEIANYVFCKRAWYLARVNAPTQHAGPERDSGVEWHEAHAERTATAAQSRMAARVLGIALLLIIGFLLYRMLAP
ncbi:MAG: hypothetical protein JOZ62_18165 [Acidobacteriaceae bacterium]|nr:hypothetical protein [Acidobacteriaceae bacterium]